MKKNKFVFVVCGTREHVDTLHFSLRALTRFSQSQILVVTDTSRNEIPVVHQNIIDIATPAQFDHHQASIFLKTSLHKILPTGNLYCYLDTDVVALNTEVDAIFNHKNGPITFAPDHCLMHQFSPYAVNCGCLNQNKKEWSELNQILEKYNNSKPITDPALLQKQQALKQKFELIKRDRIDYLQLAFRYVLPTATLRIDENTYYHKTKRIWFDKQGHPLMYDIPKSAIQQIETNTNWRWNQLKRRWISPNGKDIHQLQCNHLKQHIEQKFELQLNNPKWQHWNGGVFLFDEDSHNFMHRWHARTLHIFKDPHWKTRDQGTLIATAWQFGLQNAPLLSQKFNFIADPSNPRLMLSNDQTTITDNAFETQFAPAFIHIFHNFGKRGWQIWDWVEQKLQQQAVL